MKIGEQVREHRDKAMLTQDELGKKAGLSGYTISRIESDRVAPRVSTIRKIAGALGIEPEELTARPKVEPPLLETDEQRRRVKEAKEEILAEEGPFYSAHDITSVLLASLWRRELAKFKDRPGIRIGTLKESDCMALLQFTWDLFGVVDVYETATAEADYPRHPGYMAALQEMKDVRQEAADTLRPILHHLKDRKDTNAEFRRILQENNLEDLLSKAENR